jgi:hypothetical protein
VQPRTRGPVLRPITVYQSHPEASSDCRDALRWVTSMHIWTSASRQHEVVQDEGL